MSKQKHNPMPLITVIIPVYNMAPLLPEAVQSVVDNGYEETEIIMVDDGSTDDTLQAAKEIACRVRSYNHITATILSIAHQGKAAAVNAGLEVAKGRYITFLDADDQLPAGSLQARAERLMGDNTDIAQGEFEVYNSSGIEGRRTIPSENADVLRKKWLYGWRSPFHLNGMLMKKEVIARAGAFDEQLQRGQEMDYAIRLLNGDFTFSFIHAPVYQYHQYRPLWARLAMRAQTFKYKMKILAKHTEGAQRVNVIAWNVILQTMKFIYNIFGNYKG